MFNILIGYLLESSVIAMIMHIWFNTEAFIEYITLLNLEEYFMVGEYKDATKDDPLTTYPEYLIANHSNFFTRLISCPICLGTQLSIWLSIPIVILSFKYMIMPYFLFLVPPISIFVPAYFSLALYHLLVKLGR